MRHDREVELLGAEPARHAKRAEDAPIGAELVVDEHVVDVGMPVDESPGLRTHHYREAPRPQSLPERREERGRQHDVPEKARLGHDERRAGAAVSRCGSPHRST